MKAREKIGGASSILPLCLLDVQEEESEAEDVLRDSIMRGKYSVLYDAAHGELQTALHLRFKVLELFGAE